MPAAEVEEELFADERNSYEFAFHVLPTVAEGEVAGVFEELKALITTAGGEIFSEETPEHIDLAYTIVQSVNGKHRKYASSYFGWVRFRLNSELMTALTEEVDANQSLLRHIIIKLTKADEENPFRFHENRKSQKMTQVVGDEEKKEAPKKEEAKKEEAAPEKVVEETKEVEAEETKTDSVDEKAEVAEADETAEKKEEESKA